MSSPHCPVHQLAISNQIWQHAFQNRKKINPIMAKVSQTWESGQLPSKLSSGPGWTKNAKHVKMTNREDSNMFAFHKVQGVLGQPVSLCLASHLFALSPRIRFTCFYPVMAGFMEVSHNGFPSSSRFGHLFNFVPVASPLSAWLRSSRRSALPRTRPA